MKETVLIVEDDRELNKGLCHALKLENRQVISCMTLKSAREQLMMGEVSLILLDENLPDGSGLDFLKEQKELHPDCPIIMVTANDTDMDIVEGLESGADDYITKPFSLAVLRARVNAQLRKGSQSVLTKSAELFQCGNYIFDFQKMVFLVDQKQVELSKTEQKLLRILVENQGNTVSRVTLVDRIWTDGAEYVDENALSVSIKRLRDKLKASSYIKTVYGIGYTWVKTDE